MTSTLAPVALAFSARCINHAEVFTTTDRAEFRAHMATEHGRKKSDAERNQTLKIEKSHSWRAPRAARDDAQQWAPDADAPGAPITWRDKNGEHVGTVWSVEGTVRRWVMPDGYQHGDVLVRVHRPSWSAQWLTDGTSAPDAAARMRREDRIVAAGRIVVAGERVKVARGGTMVVREVAHAEGCEEIDSDGVLTTHSPRRFLALQHGHDVYGVPGRSGVGTWRVVDYCATCLPLDVEPVAQDAPAVAVEPITPDAAPESTVAEDAPYRATAGEWVTYATRAHRHAVERVTDGGAVYTWCGDLSSPGFVRADDASAPTCKGCAGIVGAPVAAPLAPTPAPDLTPTPAATPAEIIVGGYVSWDVRGETVTARVQSLGDRYSTQASLMATDGYTEAWPNGLPSHFRPGTAEEAAAFEALRAGRIAPATYE